MPSVRRLTGKDFNGYLRIRLPQKLDEVVDSVVDAYAAGSQATRKDMLDAVDRRSAGVLSAYGQRMAAMAVRRGSVDTLRRGLIAMAMAEGALEDYRDNLIVLSAVNHSAELLETRLDLLVDDIAHLISPRALQTFTAFTRRSSADKTLTAMGLAASGTGDDFTYVPG